MLFDYLRRIFLRDKIQDSSTDSVKKAVAAEKNHLKELAGVEMKRNQLIADYFNSQTSRVRIVKGIELDIEPESPMKNIRRYLFSKTNIGWFFGYWGFAISTSALLIYWYDHNKIRFALPIATRQMDYVIYAILLIISGIPYVRGVLVNLSELSETFHELSETFHLKVSGRNFMIHSGNPDEPIAAASKVQSDGQQNIAASINEKKGKLKIEWAYGPDINNLITGNREFQAWQIPGISKPYDLIENVTFGLLSSDPTYLPPLNLKDLDTVRKFLKDNGIAIESDWRINE